MLSLDERSANTDLRHGRANCGVFSLVSIYVLFYLAVGRTEYSVYSESKMMWTEAAVFTVRAIEGICQECSGKKTEHLI